MCHEHSPMGWAAGGWVPARARVPPTHRQPGGAHRLRPAATAMKNNQPRALLNKAARATWCRCRRGGAVAPRRRRRRLLLLPTRGRVTQNEIEILIDKEERDEEIGQGGVV
jgi:hypothetical protein